MPRQDLTTTFSNQGARWLIRMCRALLFHAFGDDFDPLASPAITPISMVRINSEDSVTWGINVVRLCKFILLHVYYEHGDIGDSSSPNRLFNGLENDGLFDIDEEN